MAASEAKKRPGTTQFARALSELNIDILCANTPQAQGRVERAHLTLQDRLVKELRLRELSTREDGNAYLPSFREDYNARFARLPRSLYDTHRPVRADEGMLNVGISGLNVVGGHSGFLEPPESLLVEFGDLGDSVVFEAFELNDLNSNQTFCEAIVHAVEKDGWLHRARDLDGDGDRRGEGQAVYFNRERGSDPESIGDLQFSGTRCNR